LRCSPTRPARGALRAATPGPHSGADRGRHFRQAHTALCGTGTHLFVVLGTDRCALLVTLRRPHAPAIHGALLFGHQLATEHRLGHWLGSQHTRTRSQQGYEQRGQSNGSSEHDRLLHESLHVTITAAVKPPAITCLEYSPPHLNRT
jgi:hypothetical protein